MKHRADKSSFAWAARLKQALISPKTVALVFAVYLLLGAFIAKDYGISTDEPVERKTSLHNYVYVMGETMSPPDIEAVQSEIGADGLMAWTDRFYGTALQVLTVFVEHMNDFAMPARDVFVLRHVFTFLNYFAGGVFFYLILRRRFGKSFLPLLGALFYILYPRFFGESFYNIKDILFFSWVIIACYFVLRWLEAGNGKFCLIAAGALAVATNTRILGISLLLLGCAFSFIRGLQQKTPFSEAALPSLRLCAATFVCYVFITPFLWENPIKNSIDTFFHFIHFQPWNSTHLYLGEMITRDVPWHYIPVWMGVTIPLLYIALFLIGFAAVCAGMALFIRHTVKAGGIKKWLARRKGPDSPIEALPQGPARLHLYDLFFFALFTCTLLGYILLHISMYEGWRHAYSIFCPFLYLAVYGAERAFSLARGKGRFARPALAGVVAAGLCFQLGWIAYNHPYQYAYFNAIGRPIAEENFVLDTWAVSQADLLRYTLAHDDRPQIKIAGEVFVSDKSMILSAEENSRIIWTDLDSAEYYLGHTRIPLEERAAPWGFAEETSATVDGMKISTLYRREAWPGEIDDNAWSLVRRVDSNALPEILGAIHDNDYDTRWITGLPQVPGDYILFEFTQPVEYDYFVLAQGPSLFSYPRGLSISTSLDGRTWNTHPVTGRYQLGGKPQPYRFLKLENNANDADFWGIAEMQFGHLK